jgi:hypothetical protein
MKDMGKSKVVGRWRKDPLPHRIFVIAVAITTGLTELEFGWLI